MAKIGLDKFNPKFIVSQILKYGAYILFAASAIVLALLSFVDDIVITPSIRNLAIFGIASIVFNNVVWHAFFKQNYDDILFKDITNSDYCIHKRYYDARKGWKYDALQEKIHEHNLAFREAWIKDVENITGRTREQIKNEPYRYKVAKTKPFSEEVKKNRKGEIKYKRRFHSNLLLLWRIKTNKIPKSGLKTPRQLLQVLSVGTSGKLKINTNAAETHSRVSGTYKLFMTIFGALLMAAIVFDFVDGKNILSSIMKLILSIVVLFMNLFFGSASGMKGGKIKLSVAEEVSEKLEEWKGSEAKEVPFRNCIATTAHKEPEEQVEITEDVAIEIT